MHPAREESSSTVCAPWQPDKSEEQLFPLYFCRRVSEPLESRLAKRLRQVLGNHARCTHTKFGAEQPKENKFRQALLGLRWRLDFPPFRQRLVRLFIWTLSSAWHRQLIQRLNLFLLFALFAKRLSRLPTSAMTASSAAHSVDATRMIAGLSKKACFAALVERSGVKSVRK